jgi:imidazolonepropionase-like amidohydrolase
MATAFLLTSILGIVALAPQGPPAPQPAQQPTPQPQPQQPAPQPQPATPPMPWRPLPSPVSDDAEDTIAIKVKRAITVSGEPIDDATILVRGGKIVSIGKLVDVPKGARNLDMGEFTAMPGLVLALSRAGYSQRSAPQGAATKAKDGIDPEAEIYQFAAKAGITTMAIVPSGSGIVGQATVIRPRGKTIDEMVKKDDGYLFSTFEMSTPSKDLFRTSFEKAKEAMEQWEKQQKEAAAPPAPGPQGPPAPGQLPASVPASGPATQPAAGAQQPPKPPVAKPDARTEVLMKEKKLMTQMGGAGGFGGATSPAPEVLHFTDALKKFELDRIYSGGPNFALVTDQLRDANAVVVMAAEENAFEPYTRNRLNGPEELRRAGVKVALLPQGDTRDGYENWLHKTGELVRYGLPEKDALRSVTLTPAEFLGMGSEIGALAPGHEADILFLDGPPFDATTRVRRVMIGGELMKEDAK